MLRDRRKSVNDAMILVTSGIFASRLLGLARDVVFSWAFGSGDVLAVFVIAFTVPNLLRALLGEGAISAAFVPLFNEKLEQEGRKVAFCLASRVLTVLLFILCLIALFVMLLGGIINQVVDNAFVEKVSQLLILLMPYAVFICCAVVLASILNSIGHFGVAAYAPLLLNILLIAAALMGRLFDEAPGKMHMHLLASAVLAAGFLHVGINWWSCRRNGVRLHFLVDWHHSDVKAVVNKMLPVLVGTGVLQLNVLIDRFLAGILGSVATTSLYYSQRLIYLPVGLFGVAMGMVILPSLSKASARKDDLDMAETFTDALAKALFLTLPCVALLLVTGPLIIQILFERGAFTELSRLETLHAFYFFLPGIPAFVVAKVAVTPFYAVKDTAMPVKISAGCLVLNTILNLILMQFLAHGGLALASVISSYTNVLILMVILQRRFATFRFEVVSELLKCMLASAGAAGISQAVMSWTSSVEHDFGLVFLRLVGAVSSGLASFVVLAYVCKSCQMHDFAVVVKERLFGKP